MAKGIKALKIYFVNGSPRKQWNTGTVLKRAIEGATSVGAETELINLYDLKYKGCISCFACKMIGGKFHGKCAQKDDLSPILEKLSKADGIVFGTPIYFYNITSGMQAFLERFFFPYDLYSREIVSGYPKKIPIGFIYTMNMTAESMHMAGIDTNVKAGQLFAEEILGMKPEVLYVNNTYQFSNYSKYESSKFSEIEKAAYKQTQFPIDCQKAFEIGRKIAEEAK